MSEFYVKLPDNTADRQVFFSKISSSETGKLSHMQLYRIKDPTHNAMVLRTKNSCHFRGNVSKLAGKTCNHSH